VHGKLAASGVEAQNTTPEKTASLLKAEAARWTQVVKASGVKMQ
jgi:tripartite-type tricarboxylate transporter receptor subunit TctC